MASYRIDLESLCISSNWYNKKKEALEKFEIMKNVLFKYDDNIRLSLVRVDDINDNEIILKEEKKIGDYYAS